MFSPSECIYLENHHCHVIIYFLTWVVIVGRENILFFYFCLFFEVLFAWNCSYFSSIWFNFFCSSTAVRTRNTMILRLSSSILRFFGSFEICPFLWNASRLASLYFNRFILLSQDDAIRNLFSAKTIHEFSTQSLLTFLVLLCELVDFLASIFLIYLKPV